MTKITTKIKYTRHSQEYKDHALELAKQVGIAKCARQLQLHESQLYTWRKNAQHQATISQRESSLACENVLLKKELARAREELAIAKKAATYFAKQLS